MAVHIIDIRIRLLSGRVLEGGIQRRVVAVRRERFVRMRERDGVDARNLAQRVNVILGAVSDRRRGVKARVSHGDNNIGSLCLHFRYELCSRCRNIFGDDFAFQICFVPIHDLRSYETKQTNLD
ncbi:hypothetical protein D3C73_1427310 [compost metagenome]